jgi:predicted RNA-binding Zn-ribbon protein involved in translation (DUF1610 family)
MVGANTEVTFQIGNRSTGDLRFISPDSLPPLTTVRHDDKLTACDAAPVVTTSETVFHCKECGSKTTTRITETVRKFPRTKLPRADGEEGVTLPPGSTALIV